MFRLVAIRAEGVRKVFVVQIMHKYCTLEDARRSLARQLRQDDGSYPFLGDRESLKNCPFLRFMQTRAL